MEVESLITKDISYVTEEYVPDAAERARIFSTEKRRNRPGALARRAGFSATIGGAAPGALNRRTTLAQPTLSLVTADFRWRRARPLVVVLIASFLLSGCASIQRNATCALVGFGVGSAVGIGIAATDNSASGVEIGGEVAAGAIGGALIGYGVCAITEMVQ